jgi:radical SAM protein with 4Fe4S-binding SPASM domain
MCPVAFRGEGSGVRGQRPAFMAFETFCALLDQFPDITQLQLQGMGEPFLHPRFFDMVRHAASRGIEVSTNSNLTALSERRAGECVASGLKKLHVSLDAADAAAYAYIRVGSSLTVALRNLERLVAAKQRLGASDPQITLVAVAMRRNLEQLPPLVRLAHGHGVRSMSVQHLAHDFTEESLPSKYRPMREFVDAQTLLGEDPARVEHWFDEAASVAKDLGVELRLPRVSPRPHRKRGCDWPWRGAYIAYSGEAMPCCMTATPDRVNFGNMARDGVARIWSGDEYKAFRDKLASDEPPQVCRGCAVYNGTF